jgi:hypothetical protein
MRHPTNIVLDYIASHGAEQFIGDGYDQGLWFFIIDTNALKITEVAFECDWEDFHLIPDSHDTLKSSHQYTAFVKKHLHKQTASIGRILNNRARMSVSIAYPFAFGIISSQEMYFNLDEKRRKLTVQEFTQEGYDEISEFQIWFQDLKLPEKPDF